MRNPTQEHKEVFCRKCLSRIPIVKFASGKLRGGAYHNARKFCSVKCKAQSQKTGEKNPRWMCKKVCPRCECESPEISSRKASICNGCRYKLYVSKRIHEMRTRGSFDTKAWLSKVQEMGFRCQICLITAGEAKMTIDHIIPVSKGGTNHINNLQPLCLRCNLLKRDKIIINA